MSDKASQQSHPPPILRNPQPCRKSRPNSRSVSPRGTRQSSPFSTNPAVLPVSDLSTQRNPSAALGRSLFGTEPIDRKKEMLYREYATQATPGTSILEEGGKQLGGQIQMEIPPSEVPTLNKEQKSVDFERQELGRKSGGSTYDSIHHLGRRDINALAMAGEVTRSERHVVIDSPPGYMKRDNTTGSYGGTSSPALTANTVHNTKSDIRRISGGQSDGTGDGRLSHAALLRLPSHAAATKSHALFSEGPLPRRRKSSTRSLRAHIGNEKQEKRGKTQSENGMPIPSPLSGTQLGDDIAGTESEDEGNEEWDEESLLQLTDWWRQVLAAGATPSPKQMAMMDSFLGEFIKEDMPKADMVLRTRLHRLLVAIIDSSEIRFEGEEEERFRELERKASLLERRWMKATRGRLFGMERERRDIMFGKSGRLAMVQPYSGVMEGPRWVTERNERAGMADADPGAWWLNTTCAYRDGMIGNTQGYVSNFKQHAHPTLVLEVGEEFPTSSVHTTRYVNEGTIYYMLLPLFSTLDKPIRILRNWTLKSKLAPPAGLRYDGWYDVLSYAFKRVSEEEDTFRVEVLMRRCGGQVEMGKVLMVPTPSMLDEWEEYLAIRDDEMRREKSVAEYEDWHRREREGELEREMWLCERAEEEARSLEKEGVVHAWEGLED